MIRIGRSQGKLLSSSRLLLADSIKAIGILSGRWSGLEKTRLKHSPKALPWNPSTGCTLFTRVPPPRRRGSETLKHQHWTETSTQLSGKERVNPGLLSQVKAKQQSLYQRARQPTLHYQTRQCPRLRKSKDTTSTSSARVQAQLAAFSFL